ncbi:MAG: cation-transporting P-type ATPase, partial [Ilumatobacter sp.]|nr:cation-transporting P-type ATPase [Ilumatobacter sp.]
PAEPDAPHHRPAPEVAADHGVDPSTGLTTIEAASRLANHGPNELAAAPRIPAWRRFLAQFKDLLILILLGAAVVAFVVSGEIKTPAVVLTVVLLNAVIGFMQENRAERSLDALRTMLVSQARVRRDGETHAVDTAALVPGDIVLVEAGDRVP